MKNRVAEIARAARVKRGLYSSLLVLGGSFLAAAQGCSNPPPYEDSGDEGGGSDTPPNVVDGDGTGDGSAGNGDGSAGNGDGSAGNGDGSAGNGDDSGDGGDGPGDDSGDGGDEPGDDSGDSGDDGDCLPDVMGHPDCSVDYPTYDGFTLTVAEEFNGSLDLDNDPIWTWSDGGLDEGRVRFVKEQIVFEDGVMKLIAESGPVSGSQSFAEVKVVGEKPLKSGEFRSKYNNFRYGRYEVRMKAPTLDNPPDAQEKNPDVNGNFIATLFAFRTPKCDQWREIDIEVTGDAPGAVGTNLVYANNTTAYGETQNDFRRSTREFNARADFHVYAFEWLPNKVTYYVDGEVIREETGTKVPVPAESAKVMMNLWIFGTGCGFGGPCTNMTYPIWSEYDYFRFYKWDGENTYPCSPTPACLPDSDLDGAKNNPTDGVPNLASCSG